MIEASEISINEKLDNSRFISEFLQLGPKFKEYFKALNDVVDIEKVIKPFLAEGGTLIHTIVMTNNPQLVEFILENYDCNLNAVNDLGQTPTFYVQEPEIARILISNGADLTIKDNEGNIWITNPSLKMIDFAIENNYLSKDFGQQAARLHFSKGNYEHSSKLFTYGFEINPNPISDIVDSIINGIEKSIEKNKYQALLNLIELAGISIPSEFQYLLSSFKDDHNSHEFNFIYGLLHKLGDHYLNLAKAEMAKAIGEDSEELDYAFKNIDFSLLQAKYPENKELRKIENAFDSYYHIVGKAMNLLDNDFSIQVLSLNGLRPDPLENEVRVFRGMKVDLSEDDINSYFKYGHRAFSSGEYQKNLGFYVDQSWNEVKAGRWEYGGTYTSVQASWAGTFADGATTSLQAESVVIELRNLKAQPKICGSWKHEYELILGTVEGENIVAIYTISISNSRSEQKYEVIDAIKNPYLEGSIIPTFKQSDIIKYNENAHKIYLELGCNSLPTTSNYKSSLYKDYDDFMAHYTPDLYMADKARLIEDYFADRMLYEEKTIYGASVECNLYFECC